MGALFSYHRAFKPFLMLLNITTSALSAELSINYLFLSKQAFCTTVRYVPGADVPKERSKYKGNKSSLA